MKLVPHTAAQEETLYEVGASCGGTRGDTI